MDNNIIKIDEENLKNDLKGVSARFPFPARIGVIIPERRSRQSREVRATSPA